MQYTPKQRMLNAYRGKFSDRYPVAPEFWYYYPAKILGVDMIEFERNIPLWEALQKTFVKFGTEGWGIAWAAASTPYCSVDSSSFKKVSDTQYLQKNEIKYMDKVFNTARMYDKFEPSWVTEYAVKDESDLETFFEMNFHLDTEYDFKDANEAHEKVGEDYLLEMTLQGPFFDFVGSAMGFQDAVFYFIQEDPGQLQKLREMYIDKQIRFIREAVEKTNYESFFIGCSYSCNSLLGPDMWRQWDKPGIKAVADELHRHGKHLHIHFHGKCMESVADFAEIGIDCVCPFERPPGGDVEGVDDLKKVRKLLDSKVTMNGNVNTVETLIRGTEDDVRREVREIKDAFKGEPRLIIGSGDQVGYETPEENIYAMIDEAKR